MAAGTRRRTGTTTGKDEPGASEIWMAFVSPSMSRRGEWRGGPPIAAAQAAATLVKWMGIDWTKFDRDAARPVH
jgi:hypothetical protein